MLQEVEQMRIKDLRGIHHAGGWLMAFRHGLSLPTGAERALRSAASTIRT